MKQVQDTFEILYNYLLSETTGKDNDLLESWTSKVIKSGDHGFEKGLLGLGWLIAFLIENSYIEGEADEILEDIDDRVYKLTIKQVLNETFEVKDLLFYITYYQQRLSYDSNAHFFRRFAHLECMKLLIEKLNTFLLEAPLKSLDTINDKGSILLKYSFLIKTCINESMIEKAFYFAAEELINFFEGHINMSLYQQEVVKLKVCVRQYENPYWEDKLNKIIKQYEFVDDLNGWGALEANCEREKVKLKELIKRYAKNIEDKLLFEWLTNVIPVHTYIHT